MIIQLKEFAGVDLAVVGMWVPWTDARGRDREISRASDPTRGTCAGTLTTSCICEIDCLRRSPMLPILLSKPTMVSTWFLRVCHLVPATVNGDVAAADHSWFLFRAWSRVAAVAMVSARPRDAVAMVRTAASSSSCPPWVW